MGKFGFYGAAQRLQYGSALRESEAGMTQTGTPKEDTREGGRRTATKPSRETPKQRRARLRQMVQHLPQPIPSEE